MGNRFPTLAPQENSNAFLQRCGYEDVDLTGERPIILPKPQAKPLAAGASAAGDVYATVNKGNRSQPAAGPSTSEESSVYATVDKSKKKPSAPAPAKADKVNPDVKPKPDKKDKAGKAKDKGKGKKREKEGTFC